MRNLKRIGSLLLAVMMGVSVASAVVPNIMKNVDEKAMNKWVEAEFKKMSKEERVAQMMVIGVSPREKGEKLDSLKKLVKAYNLGGLIFHEMSMNDYVSLYNEFQTLARTPLMMTIDGEWGLGMRLDGVKDYPRSMSLGAVTDKALIYEYGKETGRQMKAAGVHVNFAPVLDVNDNPKNPVIGRRAFGETPDFVTAYALEYARGMEEEGVLSTGKHFPGHGSTHDDSHKTLPSVTKSMGELEQCELKPFADYIQAGYGGMLTAHLNIPAIDATGTPTSLSAKAVNDLLVDKMGFEGLIFTDALSMEGAVVEGSRSLAALKAGNDVLLMPKNPPVEIAAILEAVKKGEVSQKRIDEGCKKMLRYKYALGANERKFVDIAKLADAAHSPAAKLLNRTLTAASITVVKNEGEVLPVKALDKKNIAVVSLGDMAGVTSMFQDRCEMYAKTGKFAYIKGATLNTLLNKLKEYNTIIVGVYGTDEVYVKALEAIVAQCDNVVPVFFCRSYDASLFKAQVAKCKTTVIAWSADELAQDYAAQTIFGGNGAKGTSPITIEGVAKVGDGVKYEATRLGYTVPEEVGVSSDMLKKIDRLANRCLRAGAFPGCQVLIARRGKVIANLAYGVQDYETGLPVTTNTLYDLASVSKATGTLPGIMKACDEGLLNVDEKMSKYVPGMRRADRQDLTLREFLYHETGYIPSLPIYNIMTDKDGNLRSDLVAKEKSEKYNIKIGDDLWLHEAAYDTVMHNAYTIKLMPNKKMRYSCVNFCLLMDAEQHATGVRHDEYVTKNFYAPLGAWHTTYRPLDKFPRCQVAPTEYDEAMRKQKVWGYVHDETNAFSGGIAGNAGLFSNANDLAKLCQMWLNGGVYGGERYLSEATTKQFTEERSEKSRRGLGFDRAPNKEGQGSPTCDEAPAETYGHLGFTGTVFWVDPTHDVTFIFLCNRVNPTRNNKAFGSIDIRPAMFRFFYESLLEK